MVIALLLLNIALLTGGLLHLRLRLKKIEKRLELARSVPAGPALRSVATTPTKRLIEFNKGRWPTRQHRDRVVLTSVYEFPPHIWCGAYFLNALADRHDAVIESFVFGEYGQDLTRIYESFGAPLCLGNEAAARFRDRAEAEADSIFSNLRSKEDVVAITHDGLPLGDLIYDTYLRHLALATVDLRDPRLRDYIREALEILHSTRDYFARRKVTALMVDHLVYIHRGIVVRVAWQSGVEIWQQYFGPNYFLYRYNDHQSPADTLAPTRWPWYRYPEIFSALSAGQRESALAMGRRALQDRLAGKTDGALSGQSAYAAPDGSRVFPEGDKPRCVVFLHDFCDAVHVFRSVLFPDFWEWITFLLERAEKTNVDWFVKPHPNNNDPHRAAMNKANSDAVETLKARFPKVHFLPPSASNRQMLAEGVTALFTVYGSVGCEFGYAGIPVVNAGDNPHIGYRFVTHPASREEYERLIFNVDKLPAPTEEARAEAEEYFYMNHLHFSMTYSGTGNPIPPSTFKNQDWVTRCSRRDVFDDFIAAATPEREEELHEYFERRFNR